MQESPYQPPVPLDTGETTTTLLDRTPSETGNQATDVNISVQKSPDQPPVASDTGETGDQATDVSHSVQKSPDQPPVASDTGETGDQATDVSHSAVQKSPYQPPVPSDTGESTTTSEDTSSSENVINTKYTPLSSSSDNSETGHSSSDLEFISIDYGKPFPVKVKEEDEECDDSKSAMKCESKPYTLKQTFFTCTSFSAFMLKIEW